MHQDNQVREEKNEKQSPRKKNHQMEYLKAEPFFSSLEYSFSTIESQEEAGTNGEDNLISEKIANTSNEGTKEKLQPLNGKSSSELCFETVIFPSKEIDQEIRQKFHHLLNLYLKEEILKHHCERKGWKCDRKLIDKAVMPFVKQMKVNKNSLEELFEPFLNETSAAYLLYTQLDTYSRLESSQLVIQLTQAWIKICEAESALKKKLKKYLKQFKQAFFLNEPIVKINRKKFYQYLFKDKKIKMANMISLNIFYDRCLGEDQQKNFGIWVKQN